MLRQSEPGCISDPVRLSSCQDQKLYCYKGLLNMSALLDIHDMFGYFNVCMGGRRVSVALCGRLSVALGYARPTRHQSISGVAGWFGAAHMKLVE